ncbi:MAG TPA: MAE_28990/MAE_18760 family HEPN-like nuclease [Burkholderiaceae bacterium]|nr:MAE_28990/MAE_18760 family HEPN-like nuclease [Burkholderiaceae bacterium]
MSKDDALQKIDADLIWRKKELTSIKALVEGASQGHQSAMIRSALCLLYSHWEGFVKCAASVYLRYVCELGKPPSELKNNFIAIKFLSHLREAAKSNKPSMLGETIGFIANKWNDRLRISHKSVIDTQSNLSSAVLKEISWIIGIDSASFETKFHLIDSSLVSRRNHIAHGEFLDLNKSDYIDLHKDIVNLLEIFRTELQNSLELNSYLRQ